MRQAATGDRAPVAGRGRLTDADRLDMLARALADAGWSSSPRYERIPPLIHVFAPDLPWFGESVLVADGPAGVPWFESSTGDLLAPCDDLTCAVGEIAAGMARLLAIARAEPEER
ncbi:hypothetical protein [Actinomadura nitritigenes]|uniref:hypothetical protein n=1 Tax=Actinomadura nitritigenes TaxID=134602 RepID=UPI003D8F08C8